MPPNDPEKPAPIELAADAAYTPTPAIATFDAAPDQRVYLVAEAEVEGDARAVRFGLAIDGATDHEPHDGDYTLVVAPGALPVDRRTVFYLLPWERPRFILPPGADPNDPANRDETPNEPPVGHVTAGAHRAVLWARAEGGAARVLAVSLRVAATPAG